MNSALQLAIIENGDISNWGIDTITYNPAFWNEGQEPEDVTADFRSLDNLTKYLNIATDCGHSAKGCFSHKYTQLDKAKVRDFEKLSYYRKIQLTDGTLIALQGYGLTTDMGMGEIWVDVNGQKGPNVVGEDMFLFLVANNKVSPFDIGNIIRQPLSLSACNMGRSGSTCSGWVLQYGNLDYLHCNDLEWGKKTKC